MRHDLLLALAALSLAACATSSEAPQRQQAEERPTPKTAGSQPGGKNDRATAAPIVPLKETKFGAAITETTVTPLASILADPSRFVDKTVRTEGIVTSVCQSRGCWMQIADETGAAHVKFAGYGFFVPKEASGHRAIVQGKIVPTEDTCAAKDGCREKGEQASGVVAKVDFEATGVEFVN